MEAVIESDEPAKSVSGAEEQLGRHEQHRVSARARVYSLLSHIGYILALYIGTIYWHYIYWLYYIGTIYGYYIYIVILVCTAHKPCMYRYKCIHKDSCKWLQYMNA